VTSGAEPEHWFDRLAEQHTRGRFVRSALAAVAMTLPVARGLSAFAATSRSFGCPGQLDSKALNDNPYAWKRACVIDADKRYMSTEAACVGQFGHTNATAAAVLGALAKYAPALVPGEVMNQVALQKCVDGALLQRTGQLRNCAMPDAPGFNPCQKGGPCEFCGGICCADPKSVDGFSCCTPPPGGCCKSDGCHSGITECKGA
jgi:hypothetical protein